MTDAFWESSNIAEKDYDVILGHPPYILSCREWQAYCPANYPVAGYFEIS